MFWNLTAGCVSRTGWVPVYRLASSKTRFHIVIIYTAMIHNSVNTKFFSNSLESVLCLLIWPSDLRWGFVAARLVGLRVRIPPGAWMFVLCVLYSKDRRQSQDEEDKEVQIKYREQKKIPPEACMYVSCECYVVSGIGLCDRPIPRPEESYRLWCVIVCGVETSKMRRRWPALGCCTRGIKTSLIWLSSVFESVCK